MSKHAVPLVRVMKRQRPQQGASAEAEAAAESFNEGTDADWEVLASAVALPRRAVPAPFARVVEAPGAEASGDDPGLEERMRAEALVACPESAQPRAVEENIFEPDNRVRINDTTAVPWRVPGSIPGNIAPCRTIAQLAAGCKATADVQYQDVPEPY